MIRKKINNIKGTIKTGYSVNNKRYLMRVNGKFYGKDKIKKLEQVNLIGKKFNISLTIDNQRIIKLKNKEEFITARDVKTGCVLIDNNPGTLTPSRIDSSFEPNTRINVGDLSITSDEVRISGNLHFSTTSPDHRLYISDEVHN